MALDARVVATGGGVLSDAAGEAELDQRLERAVHRRPVDARQRTTHVGVKRVHRGVVGPLEERREQRATLRGDGQTAPAERFASALELSVGRTRGGSHHGPQLWSSCKLIATVQACPRAARLC